MLAPNQDQPPIAATPVAPQVPPVAVEPPDPLDALRSLTPPLTPSDAQGGEPLDPGTEALAQVELLTERQALQSAYPDLEDSEIIAMQSAKRMGNTHAEHALISRGVERRLERESKSKETKLDSFQVEGPSGGAPTQPESTRTASDRKKAALAFLKNGGK